MQENTKSVVVKMTARRCFRTEPIWQYDVGHELTFEGFDLPASFEVHFSRSPMGNAIPQVGTNGVCTVPDMYTQSAGVIYAWLYIADTETGLTKYSIEIPVQRRAKPTNQVPTPVEQSAIDQAIAALNAGVEAAEDAQEAAEAAQASAESYAESAGQSAITATNAATAAAASAGNAAASATSAASSATDANASRQAAGLSATNAGISERNAAASATAAAGSATSAAASASQASGSATVASGSASTASTKASEAAQSATAAAGSAASASEDAGTASTAATAAETSATAAAGSATAAAGSATSAGQSATAAAGSAAAAQEVLESIPEDYSDLSEDVDSLKSAIDNDIMPRLYEVEISRNIFTPAAIRLYPDTGSYTINSDGTITLTGLTTSENVWITPQADFDLPAGDYVLCMDNDLYLYGSTTFAIQSDSGGTFHSIITANSNKYAFTYDGSDTGNKRVVIYFGSNYSNVPINWTGHVWLVRGEYQEYMPVGGKQLIQKEFVMQNQGVENAGKILSVNDEGEVYPKEINIDSAVQKTMYKVGNLVNYDEVEAGYINSSGGVTPYETLWCSGFMPVVVGKVYCSVTGANGGVLNSQYFSFYDENKENPVTYSVTGAMTRLTPVIYYIDVPEGCAYFRCTFSSNQNEIRKVWVSQVQEKPPVKDLYNCNEVFPYTLNPENPCDYSELTVRAFSKAVCIGDSLTYGGFNMDDSSGSSGETQSKQELSDRYSYPSNFQRITGIDTTNEGDSGETTVSWYNNHSSHDFSQYDLAIIHLGVNDSAFSVSDADTLDAMQNIVTMLNNARSDMRIAICSVIPAYNGTGYQAKGQLILNWAKSLNNPNIIPVDLAAYSHVQPETSYVAGHLSALGYYMMAYDIARYISWYMDQHKRDFRFIQFIGSPDAEWSGD